MISVPSSLHVKWAIHIRWRGLNNVTHSALYKSRAWVCLPLKALHLRQGEPQILFASCTASSLWNQVVKLHGHAKQRFTT